MEDIERDETTSHPSEHVQQMKENKQSKGFLVLGIIFVAFNLRPAITSVGPIIHDIQASLHFSTGVAGFVTTLPLLAFAAISPIAAALAQRIGDARGVFLGLLLLICGILIRGLSATVPLFIGTAIVGIGIALCNVLLPSMVKQRFPNQVGLMTSVYTTAMCVFAALGSGLSYPFDRGFHLGWNRALLVWIILAVVTIGLWMPMLSRKLNGHARTIKNGNVVRMSTATDNSAGSQPRRSVWASPLAWQVTCFMGLQSFLFYASIAWLPEILETHHMSTNTAGWMLSIMQFVGLPATFATPLIAAKLKNQISLVIIASTLYVLSTLGFLWGNEHWLIVLSIILVGLAQGMSISVALAFLGLRTTNANEAARLSGMSQSVGYLLAAVGPVLIGYQFDWTHSWQPSLWTMFVVALLMLVAGLGAGRDLFIHRHQSTFRDNVI